MAEKKRVFLTVIILSLVLLSSCTGKKTGTKEIADEKTEFALNTVINICIYGETLTEDNWNELFGIVREFDENLDRFKPSSELSEISKNAGVSAVKISEETHALLVWAKKCAIDTGGFFDPTIGALTELWNIGGEDFVPPAESEIKEARKKVGYKALQVWEDAAQSPRAMYAELKKEGMVLDLGAIAKGRAADLVANKLREFGVRRAILDFGGNIYVLGTPVDEDAWIVGIRDPNNPEEIILKLTATDEAIVSSGTYERFSAYEDKTYHHIINPFTGKPADTDVIAATVIHPISTYADAYVTSLIVMGKQRAIDFINKEKLTAVLFYKGGSYEIFCDDKDKITEYKK